MKSRANTLAVEDPYLSKRKLRVLSQNIVHADSAVLDNAKKMLGVCPTHPDYTAFVPLCTLRA